MTRDTEDVSEEISQIKEAMEQQSHGLTMTEAVRNLARSDVRTPFLLLIANFFFVMFSGPFAIIFYSIEIFQNIAAGLDKHLASIIVAVIRVMGGILGIFLIQKLSRVRLAMLMMTLMSLSMTVLGVILYIRTFSPPSLLLDILPSSPSLSTCSVSVRVLDLSSGFSSENCYPESTKSSRGSSPR